VILPLLAATLLLAACGRDQGGGGGGGNGGSNAAPGITSTTIKLGSSYPFSGPASAYSAIPKSLDGFFKKLNDNGGINGRKIQFVTYDDGYEPQRALANAKRLVEQDKVFAIVNPLGTANNLAMEDYLNQNKVPQLFVATGATVFGSDQAKHPYTTGWQPTYQTEAKVYAQYLKTAKPNAKVAVLYQNDGFGKDLLGGFTDGIKGSGISIVAQESYEATDPTVAPQVKKLATSKADTFLDITTPKAGAQAIATVAQTGWKPLHILNSVAASKAAVLKPVGFQYSQGIVSASYFKALDDPRWANDPAVKGLLSDLKKYAPTADPTDPFTVYGWLVGETIQQALQKMTSPTRDALLDAAKHLDYSSGLLLPGISVKTDGQSDPYPIEAMQIAQFEGQNFVLKGSVIQASSG
jgi:branched-chain amino acid transport system substrate-binding protein